MQPIKKIFLGLATAWFITVLLWPKSTNLPSSDEEKKTSGTKEGLYKASLTKANFGLLGVQFYELTNEDIVHMKGPDVDRPDMTLRGVGLMADVDHEHFFLKKNVSARKRMKKNEWLDIHSHSGEFFTNESRAIFIHEVNSKMPGT